MSNTGKYIVKDGQVVKISDEASVGDIWFKKHRIDGKKDIKDGYASLEKQGKLNQVDDREVWRDYL